MPHLMKPCHRARKRRQTISRQRLTVLALALSSATSLLIPLQTGHAQSTTTNVHGSAPPAEGAYVEIKADTGSTQKIDLDRSGHYSVRGLPSGTYTITLKHGEDIIEQRPNIFLTVNSDKDVSFAPNPAPHDETTLSDVKVESTGVPTFDVSSSESSTIIGAQELKNLPTNRSAEGIALLAPGTVQGSSAFKSGPYQGGLSFGGAGVTENSYYINGFLVSNPLTNIGGLTLPYSSIDQQETFTGGYGARYGRSAGGVISQIGKHGTQNWKFGGQAAWTPAKLAKNLPNGFYTSAAAPPGYLYLLPATLGKLRQFSQKDSSSNTIMSGYIGGPLIPDKFFSFIAIEENLTNSVSTSAIDSATVGRSHLKEKQPKVYAKFDINIDDHNSLELTGISNKYRKSGYNTDFDYATLRNTGRSKSSPTTEKNNANYYIVKFTSFVTDKISINSIYGKSRAYNYENNPSQDPYIWSGAKQDPLINHQVVKGNSQSSSAKSDGLNRTRGLRFDFNWTLGKNDVTTGIDNMFIAGTNQGSLPTGPGYGWAYGAAKPGSLLNSTYKIYAPAAKNATDQNSYYVKKRIQKTASNMSLEQRAYFIEDHFHLTDRTVLTLGLRNDRFINRNNLGQIYVSSGNQWAPRLGASWDVLGNASLKMYANLGRYYLALPNSVAIRGATPSLSTDQYYSYTSIDDHGIPHGLQPLNKNADRPISVNGEYGKTPDPHTFAASNLKSMFQNEVVAGFDKLLDGGKWVTGAKMTYRNLGSAIDDVCDTSRIAAKLTKMGIDPLSVTIPSCLLFNPGIDNSFSLPKTNGSGYQLVHMNSSDWGFVQKAKRKYVALDLYLQYPSDGIWEGRLDYTLSHNFGNTEGQVNSNLGQNDVSKTQDWDAAALMLYAGGTLPNARRHQIKLRGSYSPTAEWTLGSTVRLLSGTPKSCLGFFGIDDAGHSVPEYDPVDYGSKYHVCNHKPSPPGALGTTPWSRLVDIDLTYRPSFAQHKLALSLSVFNLFNQLTPTGIRPVFEDNNDRLNNLYGTAREFTQPRSVRLTMNYDF